MTNQFIQNFNTSIPEIQAQIKTQNKSAQNITKKRRNIGGLNYGKLELAAGVTFISYKNDAPRLYLVTQGTAKWTINGVERFFVTGDNVYIAPSSENETIEVLSDDNFKVYWVEKELDAQGLIN